MLELVRWTRLQFGPSLDSLLHGPHPDRTPLLGMEETVQGT